MKKQRSHNQYPVDPKLLKKALKKVQRERFLIGLLTKTRCWQFKTLTPTKAEIVNIDKLSTNSVSSRKNMVTMVLSATFSNDENDLGPEFDNSSVILSEEECQLFEKYANPTYLTDQLKNHDLLELEKLGLPPLKRSKTQSQQDSQVDSFKQEKSSVTSGTEDDSSLEHHPENISAIMNNLIPTNANIKLPKEQETGGFNQSIIKNENTNEKVKPVIGYQLDKRITEKLFSELIFKSISKRLTICKASQTIRSFVLSLNSHFRKAV